MKYLKKKYFIIWISASLIFFCACKQSSINPISKELEIENDGNILTIDTFSFFPSEIDGCCCYFSNDSIEFKNGKYIYMNDFVQTSFLTINGVLTKFTQTEYKEIDSSTIIIKAKSNEYDLIIEMNEEFQNGYETWLKTGAISISNKSGLTKKVTFYGECGC